jgi:small-conductance mechanosensitive channel
MDGLIPPDSPGILQFLILDRVPYAVVIVLVAVFGARTFTRFLDGLGQRFPSYRLYLKQVSAVTRFAVLVGTAIAATASVVQLTDEAMLAIGGSVAFAIGFAVKDLLASLMAGVILLFDRPFVVGDRVQFGDAYGEVVEIGLRTVRIVTLDDNLVSIPNNRFLSDAVACANAGALDQMQVYPFYIGSNEDFERARRIAYEATAASRYVFLGKPIAVHLREGPIPGSMTQLGVHVIIKAYVLDGRFETAFGTDVTERVLRAWRAAGIRTVGQILLDQHPSTLITSEART